MATKKFRVEKYEEVSRACVRRVRMSPQKARPLMELIRGKKVEPALQLLKFMPKKVARYTEKVVSSALANAVERGGIDVDQLWVIKAYVDKGGVLKRFMPGAHGRANPILKRYTHITVVLGSPKASV